VVQAILEALNEPLMSVSLILKGHDKGRTLNIIIERLRKIGYSNIQYKNPFFKPA
jgi:site-specific DNA-cytosine methylase